MSKWESMRLAAQRVVLRVLLIGFVLSIGAQVLPTVAGAAAQITARSITIGSSAVSTATTYKLTFTPATTIAASADVVIDFCSNSPIAGDTCSFSAATVPTIASPSSSVGTASTLGSGSPIHTVKVASISGGLTSGTPVTITFSTGFTNPSTATSFYARVFTYTGAAANYVPANTTGGTTTVGSAFDAGGIALSTAANINITAKVFETLSFCVFQTSCGTPAVLTLGDPTTGALSTASAYVNSNAQYTLATNASAGVNVTMTGTTLCRPGGTCTTGANAFTISANGVTPAALATGTEQFGMCADKNSSAALTVATQYADTTSTNVCHGLTTGIYAGTSRFGFDDSATVTTGTASTGGSQVMSSTGAVPVITGTFAFLGDIAATTEAGIYTTSLNLVATGTF